MVRFNEKRIERKRGFSLDSETKLSNVIVSPSKLNKIDPGMQLLKVLMKESSHNDERHKNIKHFIDAPVKISGNYPNKSKNGKIELKILCQPEEQHRARYLTEGSRGSIKDQSSLRHPVVKLYGYNATPVRLHCYIGHDKQIGFPHLFYQASKITGKNSTRCSSSKLDGTTVIFLDLIPENNMEATIDCIGILKERNVDVEQKLARLKSRCSIQKDGMPSVSKKRSTRCRLVFRTRIPTSGEILQTVSTPILCTQPLGTPEICKMSLNECDASGDKELFIIGKNFLKDTKILFKRENWSKLIEPDKEWLHSTHLVCNIPTYDGPKSGAHNALDVAISVRSGGKYSESHTFTYTNISNGKIRAILVALFLFFTIALPI